MTNWPVINSNRAVQKMINWLVNDLIGKINEKPRIGEKRKPAQTPIARQVVLME
jgi:hypothetical protein